MDNTDVIKAQNRSHWRAYLELCKPRVVALMLLTAIVGMLLATPAVTSIAAILLATIGIGLASASGAVINHLADQQYDKIMLRTKHRPLPSGAVKPQYALLFAIVMAIVAMIILVVYINWLTAILTLASLIGYAGIYTFYLKHATPQNIVIGGAAGAAPPLLGWVAMTGHIDPGALLLFLIVFAWTPPHFWALAIHRRKEYAKANIPMLPVTHGVKFTKLNILLYTLLLFAVTLMPFVISMSGFIYLGGVILLNIGFLYWAVRLMFFESELVAMKTFRFSITYLMLLFILLLVDHYFLIV